MRNDVSEPDTAVEAAVHMPMWPYQKAPSRKGLKSKGGYDYP